MNPEAEAFVPAVRGVSGTSSGYQEGESSVALNAYCCEQQTEISRLKDELMGMKMAHEAEKVSETNQLTVLISFNYYLEKSHVFLLAYCMKNFYLMNGTPRLPDLLEGIQVDKKSTGYRILCLLIMLYQHLLTI